MSDVSPSACTPQGPRLTMRASRSCAPGARRQQPGTVTGLEGLQTSVKRLLRGSQGNIGVIPYEIGAALHSRTFPSFCAFRHAFWKAVAHSSHANEFSEACQERMRCGRAPTAPANQQVPGGFAYVLHHRLPIHRGGSVYDLGNLLIVTPRFHEEVLCRKFHGINGAYRRGYTLKELLARAEAVTESPCPRLDAPA